jgi:hypothetical protein
MPVLAECAFVALLRAEQMDELLFDTGQGHVDGGGAFRLLALDAESGFEIPQGRELAVDDRAQPCPRRLRVARPEGLVPILDPLGDHVGRQDKLDVARLRIRLGRKAVDPGMPCWF